MARQTRNPDPDGGADNNEAVAMAVKETPIMEKVAITPVGDFDEATGHVPDN